LDELEAKTADAKVISEKSQRAIAAFRAIVAAARSRIGDLRPTDAVTLSAFAGQPSYRAGEARLPAANVPALGRALFSDYLLAVELGGRLLLVATIGAIAITHRSAAKNTA
jgi:hypothetical protein